MSAWVLRKQIREWMVRLRSHMCGIAREGQGDGWANVALFLVQMLISFFCDVVCNASEAIGN